MRVVDASKMGAEVVVFSTTAAKEEEARRLGASEFYLADEMDEQLKSPIDVLIVAGSQYPDWERSDCDKNTR
jgi:D-arabinose 1-dehydrogenase-like Zn-dependent alcohol dehydrogenase